MSKLLLNKLGFNFIITNFFLLILNNLKVYTLIRMCHFYNYDIYLNFFKNIGS